MKDYSEYYTHTDSIYAHRLSNTQEKELLTDHLDKTLFYYREQNTGIIEKLCLEMNLDYEYVNEICELGVRLHDIGKATPYFQQEKMNNYLVPPLQIEDKQSHHSELSRIIFFEEAMEQFNIKTIPDRKRYVPIILLVGLSVAKHHTKISNLFEFAESILRKCEYYTESEHFDAYFAFIKPKGLYSKNFNSKDIFKQMVTISKSLLVKDSELSEYLFIFSQTYYSLLCTSDVIATKKYSSPFLDVEEDRYTDSSYTNLINNYKQTDLARHVKNYERSNGLNEDISQETDLNNLRNNLALELNKDLTQLEENENIYYLESGVGSGKTHLSHRFAVRMLQKKYVDRIFYSLPYLTISEQVEKYASLLDSDAFRVDSSTPVRYEGDGLYHIDYGKTALKRQTLNYRYGIITFVELFNLLFGTNTSSARKRLALKNSLVILDEVQALNTYQVGTFANILLKYSKIYNFKLLFMSATLPKISDVVAKDLGKNLIANSKDYIKHPLFSERNRLDKTYFDSKICVSEIIDTLELRRERLLVQAITKKSCRNIYEKISEKFPETEVFLFTSDTKKQQREEIIQKLSEKDTSGNYLNYNLIVVATNCIESGVDIDMTKGIIDLSFIDSLEQTSGRIIRNNRFEKEDSVIYLLNRESSQFMSKHRYSQPLRMKDKIEPIFEAKDYAEYNEALMTVSENNAERDAQKNMLLDLKYSDFSKAMKLIAIEEVEYYVESDEEATRLLSDWENYTRALGRDLMNFDKNFLARHDCLVALQKYKEKAINNNQKKEVMNYMVDKKLTRLTLDQHLNLQNIV